MHVLLYGQNKPPNMCGKRYCFGAYDVQVHPAACVVQDVGFNG